MSAVISIARRDVFTVDGQIDTTLYEVQVEWDGAFIQDLQLESADELIALRDALSAFIAGNSLTSSTINAQRHED